MHRSLNESAPAAFASFIDRPKRVIIVAQKTCGKVETQNHIRQIAQ